MVNNTCWPAIFSERICELNWLNTSMVQYRDQSFGSNAYRNWQTEKEKVGYTPLELIESTHLTIVIVNCSTDKPILKPECDLWSHLRLDFLFLPWMGGEIGNCRAFHWMKQYVNSSSFAINATFKTATYYFHMLNFSSRKELRSFQATEFWNSKAEL